jgi:hypothetical protein
MPIISGGLIFCPFYIIGVLALKYEDEVSTQGTEELEFRALHCLVLGFLIELATA